MIEFSTATRTFGPFEKGIRSSFERGHLSLNDIAAINTERRGKGLPALSLKGCKQPTAAVVAQARVQRSKDATAARVYRSQWTHAHAIAFNKNRNAYGASAQLMARAQAALALADRVQAGCR